jgi:hypothetical protein
LPDELEEQAILYALGILDPEDRQVFMMRMQRESALLRKTVEAYQTVIGALAGVVAPVKPSEPLRERLVERVAFEAACELEQFELAANTLALGAVPVKPRASIREQLLSRIEQEAEVPHAIKDARHGLAETPVITGDGLGSGGRRQLEQDAAGALARKRAQAWHHLVVILYTSLRLCWKALLNLLGTLLMRSVTSERVRLSGTKMAFEGLTFIKAAEGSWREIAPGAMVKVLSFDMISRRTTALLRFAPGTRYAPHRHTEAEELYVLQGGCSIAGREMTVGDYHRAEVGTEHYDTSTDEGCLLLVISSPQNEILS